MADEVDLTKEVTLEGGRATLADIMGVDLSGIAEKRFENLPRGHYTFEIESDPAPHLGVFGEGDAATAAAIFPMKVIGVTSVTDDEFKGDPDSLIGKKHRESFRLSDTDSLGYLKAFLIDIGVQNATNLKDALTAAAGIRFGAFITKRTDKNDKDKVYTSLNRNKGKITPMDGAGSALNSQVAAA